MEKRNIQITKEEALSYYKSNNEALKRIALLAFKEDELQELTYLEILNKELSGKKVFYMNDNASSTIRHIGYDIDIDSYIDHYTPDGYSEELYYETTDIDILRYMAVIIKLRNIANHFNKNLKREGLCFHIVYEESSNNLITCATNLPTYTYPVIFERREDAEYAISLLTDDEKKYFMNAYK